MLDFILRVLEIIRNNQAAFIGLLGILITWYFSSLNKKRESDKMLKELFEDFNKRYDKLNNGLYDIVTDSKVTTISELSKVQKKCIIDYFNLCAEEYFWHKRGRLNEKIWKSWKAGMNYWYGYSVISEMWHEEVKTKEGKLSYYIDNGDEFFNDYQ